MAETQNFFDNPNGNASGAGWGAGVGGLIGAAIGNGGLFGGNRNSDPAVTPDQLQTAIGTLSARLDTDQVQDQLGRFQGQVASQGADMTIALGAGIASVKDAVVSGANQNALSLCNLGHSVQSGFASVNQNILLQGAASRELALQQALDAERSRATDLRIQLSEAKNHASHTATQVMIQNLASAK